MKVSSYPNFPLDYTASQRQELPRGGGLRACRCTIPCVPHEDSTHENSIPERFSVPENGLPWYYRRRVSGTDWLAGEIQIKNKTEKGTMDNSNETMPDPCGDWPIEYLRHKAEEAELAEMSLREYEPSEEELEAMYAEEEQMQAQMWEEHRSTAVTTLRPPCTEELCRTANPRPAPTIREIREKEERKRKDGDGTMEKEGWGRNHIQRWHGKTEQYKKNLFFQKYNMIRKEHGGINTNKGFPDMSSEVKEFNRKLSDRLDAVANMVFDGHHARFKDWTHCREAAEGCYVLIALKEAEQWKSCHEGCEVVCAEVKQMMPHLVIERKGVQIRSDLFRALFPEYRLNGKKQKLPYSLLLEALAMCKIIYATKGYVVDKIPREYAIHNDTMKELMADYLANRKDEDVFDARRCFQAYYPKRLLAHQLKVAQREYAKGLVYEGISVKLPECWDSSLSEFGLFDFDERLSIDHLIYGMSVFERHVKSRRKYGRVYDWFTNCPSAFRRYLTRDGMFYRELVDCPAGIFWMFAIHGYEKGRIDYAECRKMIDGCFRTSFYEEVSGKAKSKALKRKFMMALNMSAWSVRNYTQALEDDMFMLVRGKLADDYPLWSAFLEQLRQDRKFRKYQKIGKYNHIETTKVEMILMNELMRRLSNEGVSGLRRVHDAIYGLIPGDLTSKMKAHYREVLYDVVIDHLNSIDEKKRIAA